jgi:hypothetical protein
MLCCAIVFKLPNRHVRENMSYISYSLLSAAGFAVNNPIPSLCIGLKEFKTQQKY